MRTPRRAGITAAGLMLLVLGVLAIPAVASAKSAPITVEVGPLKTAKGYIFDVSVDSCIGAKSVISIDYSKGSDNDNIDYSYSGKGSCVAKSLKKATVSLNWPKIAKLKLSVAKVLKTRKAVIPEGCSDGKGTSEQVVLAGSIGVIPSKALGQVHGKKIAGFVSQIANLKCKTPAEPKTTSLFAEFGPNASINAEQPATGSRNVFLDDGFTPAKGVAGEMFLTLFGKAEQFNISKAGVSTLTDLKPFAGGKLVATELPLCLGSMSAAQNVTLSGAITVNSPVLGKLTFGASNVTTAWQATGAAYPADCNGYGSMPLTPALDNPCSTDGFCSIQYGTNSADFDDESDQGTQTIVSETINFGDGTTGVFTNGTVSHTYAAAGTYTATVTIETSNGQTQTVTSPVYIDS